MRTTAIISFAALLTLSACRELPEPIDLGPHPADPSAPTRSSPYRPVTQGMRDYGIVAPRPWGQSNEQVAPKKQ